VVVERGECQERTLGVVVESVDVLLRQETAVSDVLLRHTSDVLLRVLAFC
jgi:hypothetical protein